MQTRCCSQTAAEYIRRKSMLERIGKAALPFAGEFLLLNRILTERRRQCPLVLCYHGVVPDEIAEDPQRYGNLTGLSEFTEQMSLLARTMTPITPSAFDDWLHNGSPLPDNSVLITFDDGYRNNLTHAAGVLRKFGIPAVIFAVVGCIGTDRLLWPTEIYRSILLWPSAVVPLPDESTIAIPPNDGEKRITLATWVREFCKVLSEESKNFYLSRLREAALPALEPSEMEMFRFLSWEELCKLHRMGFEVGSHTMEHCVLTRIYAYRLRRELEESRQQIERRLETSCLSFCYPNGQPADYSPQIISQVARAGYRAGFTTNPGACTRHMDPLALHRVSIPGKLSQRAYRSRISGLHDLLKSSLS
jgi:peptidoglycan/xylan/chitin deacetylase (PgdA/CDA1 family)